MAEVFQTDDYLDYRMDINNPHLELEPLENEIAVVDAALIALKDATILPHTTYDNEKFLAHRRAVADLFEIPWTAITPRMQRLIYAINAIVRPAHMIAVGIFCGNTFISNAGSAVGPGACYTAEALIGVEIIPEEAERAARNVQKINPEGPAKIIAHDGVEIVAQYEHSIQLLYLDADGDAARGKGIYLDILQAGYDKMPPGALVLAHNSYNAAEPLTDYLEFVRSPKYFRASVNVLFDGEGLEVSMK